MTAYYNEIDAFTAQWTRNLIKGGVIAPGDVDERSIEDVTPDDIKSYTQCHFFAGFGTWSYALRLAGFPDSRRVWTASCPCQPFSKAGKADGFADERHLWPHLHWLIQQCQPTEIYGEQVASKFAEPWIDLVHGDLEALGYAFGSIPFASASVGAPHIRDRVYWMGYANDQGLPNSQLRSLGGAGWWDERQAAEQSSSTPKWLADASISGGGSQCGQPRTSVRQQITDRRQCVPSGLADLRSNGCSEGWSGITTTERYGIAGNSTFSGLADTRSEPSRRNTGGLHSTQTQEHSQRVSNGCEFDGSGVNGTVPNEWMANPDRANPQQPPWPRARPDEAEGTGPHRQFNGRGELPAGNPAAGAVNGFWADADWLFCRDGKWRPVEPGTSALAYGPSQSVGRMQPRLESMGFTPEHIKRLFGQRNSTLAIAGRNRIGRLRAYGNAINAQQAKEFIEIAMRYKP